MAENVKEVILKDGEKTLFQIEGNAYTESPNPIVKLLAAIVRVIGKLFGWSMKTYIVVTNKRIIRVDKEKILWVIPKNIIVLTLPKNSIREIGYAQTVRFLIFKTLYFRLQTHSENTSISYNGTVEELNKIITQVTDLVIED